MKIKTCSVLSALFLLLCLSAGQAQSAPCIFNDFVVPNSTVGGPEGLNDGGVLVGSFTDQNTNHTRGFVFRSGVFTTIDFPGAASTDASGINNKGQIVGTYLDGQTFVQKAFLLQNGKFTTIFVPNQGFHQCQHH